jgi:hypothetical protein
MGKVKKKMKLFLEWRRKCRTVRGACALVPAQQKQTTTGASSQRSEEGYTKFSDNCLWFQQQVRYQGRRLKRLFKVRREPTGAVRNENGPKQFITVSVEVYGPAKN